MTSTICFPFIGDSVGGAHISAITLIENIDRSQYSILIVVHELGVLSDYIAERGHEICYLPLKSYAGTQPKYSSIILSIMANFKTIRKFCFDKNIDLVHGNDLRINLTWGLSLIFSNIIFVWHQRAIPKSDSKIWKIVPYFVGKVLVISKAIEIYFKTKLAELPILVFNPITIDSSNLKKKKHNRKKLREKFGLKSNDIVICFVGRLIPMKNLDVFIRILARLNASKNNPRIYGVVIGSDPLNLRTQYEQEAAIENVQELIFFLGFRKNIGMYISGSDVLVAPSYPEGFGRVLVEAMLLKTPVVASNGAGHKEIVKTGQNGLLAGINDEIDFRNCVERYLTDLNFKNQIIEQAYYDALKNFSASSHATAVQQIYSDLLKTK